MEDVVVPVVALGSIFVGLPWVVLHYITKWKTATTLTNGDEALLEELYQLARRLSDRMETVERLVASDHPDFQPGTPLASHPIDRSLDQHSAHNALNEVSEGIDRLRGQFERNRR